MNDILMMNMATIMITMGSISSKMKLFKSLLMTLILLEKVAVKWIQN